LHGDLLREKLIHIVFEKMGEYPCVLVVDDVLNHEVHRPNLVITKRHINCASSILVLIKNRELIVEVFFVLVTQELFDGPAVEGEVCNHVLEAELEEYFEEYLGVRLVLDQGLDIALCFARINTLNQ
jgi:hypothetical protein